MEVRCGERGAADMPLNLSNRDQSSGHLFYNRRLRAAITRFSVRMRHDDRKQQAAIALAVVLVLIGCGWMALLHYWKPAGLVGRSPIVGNRETGALYARIDDRLYPVFNLTSARLVTGSAGLPSWVTSQEIAKHPSGPMIGIPGLPDDLTITGNSTSAWAVCDAAPARNSGRTPEVTAIAGELQPGRATPIPANDAILASHQGKTFLIWSGQRTQIDPTDRSVTFNLGLDPGRTHQVPISNALFDAIPATEPLVVPPIPDIGRPSEWLTDASVGRVLETRAADGAVSGFYVLLTGGVQRVTGFVADLLRTADSQGVKTPQLISPDNLVRIPQIHELNVDFYPKAKLNFIDTEANPTTCVSWTRQSTDRQPVITLFSGRGLPVQQGLETHLVRLVKNDRDPSSVEADQTLVLPGAANFVVTTGMAVAAQSRESLYWLSPQGVRYGVESDRETLQALGIDPKRAVQAPWPLLRIFAAGPVIDRMSALVVRDSISVTGSVAPAPDKLGR
jgi:type VII secretion protein EccB